MEEEFVRIVKSTELKDIYKICKKDRIIRNICSTPNIKSIIDTKIDKLHATLIKNWGGNMRDVLDRMDGDELVKITLKPPSSRKTIPNRIYPYAVCKWFNSYKELNADFVRGFDTQEEADNYAFSLAVLTMNNEFYEREDLPGVITLDELSKEEGPGKRYNPYRKYTLSGYSTAPDGYEEIVYVVVKWFDGVLNEWNEIDQEEGLYKDNRWRPRYIDPHGIKTSQMYSMYDDAVKFKRRLSSSSNSSPKTKRQRGGASSPKNTQQKRSRSSGSSQVSNKTRSGPSSPKNTQQKRRRSSGSSSKEELDNLLSLMSKKLKL